jgi:antitoxin ParD1/3/4
MAANRINTRLSRPLAEFVEGLVGNEGLYDTPGEYVRDLIRRDMEQREGSMGHAAILSGYRDLAEGAVFESTGDFRQDMVKLAEKETNGWR